MRQRWRHFVILPLTGSLLIAPLTVAHARAIRGEITTTQHSLITEPPGLQNISDAPGEKTTVTYRLEEKAVATYKFSADQGTRTSRAEDSQRLETTLQYTLIEERRTIRTKEVVCTINGRTQAMVNRDESVSRNTISYNGPGAYAGSGKAVADWTGLVNTISFELVGFTHEDSTSRLMPRAYPLRPRFGLGGVTSLSQVQSHHQWLNNGSRCGETYSNDGTRTIDRFVNSRTLDFHWPNVVQPQFNGKIVFRGSYGQQALPNFRIDQKDWRMDSIAFDLEVTDLPNAKPKLASSSERGKPYVFDLAETSGDFKLAAWRVQVDRASCSDPKLDTLESTSPGGAKASADFMHNPVELIFEDPYIKTIRDVGVPDKFDWASPLLCDVTVQLVMEDDGLRSYSEPVRVTVTPRRNWTASIGDPKLSGVKFQEAGDQRIPIADVMSQLGAPTMVIPSFCVRGDAAFAADDCLTIHDRAHVAKWAKHLQLALIPRQHETTNTDALLTVSDVKLPGIVAVEDGPFSGMVFFTRVDNDLFQLEEVRHLDIKGDEQFDDCTDFHEWLHAFVMNKQLKEISNPASGGLRDSTPIPGLFEPKRSAEQMFDISALGLYQRLAKMAVRLAELNTNAASHASMADWRKWVSPTDRYIDGSTVVESIEKFRRSPGRAQGRKPGVPKTVGRLCGGPTFPEPP